jgi:hypothetical protein
VSGGLPSPPGTFSIVGTSVFTRAVNQTDKSIHLYVGLTFSKIETFSTLSLSIYHILPLRSSFEENEEMS